MVFNSPWKSIGFGPADGPFGVVGGLRVCGAFQGGRELRNSQLAEEKFSRKINKQQQEKRGYLSKGKQGSDLLG